MIYHSKRYLKTYVLSDKSEESTIAKTAVFVYYSLFTKHFYASPLFTKHFNASHLYASNPDASQS